MTYIDINSLDNVFLGKIKYLDGFDKKGYPIFKTTSRYYLFECVKKESGSYREYFSKVPITLDFDDNTKELEPRLTDIIKFSKEFPDISGGDFLSMLILLDEFNNNLECQFRKELLP